MNLTAFGVHHNGDGEAFLLVEPSHALDDRPVPLPRAVAHVDPRHVHSTDGQRLQVLEAARGGANGAHNLGPAGAAEAVLPQLRLRHRVHLDGAQIGGGGHGDAGAGSVVVGDDDLGGGRAEVEGGKAADVEEGEVGSGEVGVEGSVASGGEWRCWWGEELE